MTPSPVYIPLGAFGIFRCAAGWCTGSQPPSSRIGKAAAAAPNNHGTWYADEVTSLALFLGQTTVAQTTVSDYIANQLSDQILPSGAQPLELVRTNSWNYSTFNLVAATNLAVTARYLGLDLYHCAGADGSSIEAATRFLIPYATNEKAWNYGQIGSFDASLASYPLNLAANVFNDAEARKALAQVDPGPASRGDGIDPLSLALFGHTQLNIEEGGEPNGSSGKRVVPRSSSTSRGVVELTESVPRHTSVTTCSESGNFGGVGRIRAERL